MSLSLEPGFYGKSVKEGNEDTPLECEHRLVKPSPTIFILDTNDVPGISNIAHEAAMREIIEISLEGRGIRAIRAIPPCIGWEWNLGLPHSSRFLTIRLSNRNCRLWIAVQRGSVCQTKELDKNWNLPTNHASFSALAMYCRISPIRASRRAQS